MTIIGYMVAYLIGLWWGSRQRRRNLPAIQVNDPRFATDPLFIAALDTAVRETLERWQSETEMVRIHTIIRKDP